MGHSSHHSAEQANNLLQQQIDEQKEEDKERTKELMEKQEAILESEGGFSVDTPQSVGDNL